MREKWRLVGIKNILPTLVVIKCLLVPFTASATSTDFGDGSILHQLSSFQTAGTFGDGEKPSHKTQIDIDISHSKDSIKRCSDVTANCPEMPPTTINRKERETAKDTAHHQKTSASSNHGQKLRKLQKIKELRSRRVKGKGVIPKKSIMGKAKKSKAVERRSVPETPKDDLNKKTNETLGEEFEIEYYTLDLTHMRPIFLYNNKTMGEEMDFENYDLEIMQMQPILRHTNKTMGEGIDFENYDLEIMQMQPKLRHTNKTMGEEMDFENYDFELTDMKPKHIPINETTGEKTEIDNYHLKVQHLKPMILYAKETMEEVMVPGNQDKDITNMKPKSVYTNVTMGEDMKIENHNFELTNKKTEIEPTDEQIKEILERRDFPPDVIHTKPLDLHTLAEMEAQDCGEAPLVSNSFLVVINVTFQISWCHTGHVTRSGDTKVTLHCYDSKWHIFDSRGSVPHQCELSHNPLPFSVCEEPSEILHGAVRVLNGYEVYLVCNADFQTANGSEKSRLHCVDGNWRDDSNEEITCVPKDLTNCGEVPTVQNADISFQNSSYGNVYCKEGFQSNEGQYYGTIECIQGEWKLTGSKEKQMLECFADANCIEAPVPQLEFGTVNKSNLLVKGSCLEGYNFPSGEKTVRYFCKHNSWMLPPSKVVGCLPHCPEECLNGGLCILPNFCVCQIGFSGDLCQIQEIAG